MWSAAPLCSFSVHSENAALSVAVPRFCLRGRGFVPLMCSQVFNHVFHLLSESEFKWFPRNGTPSWAGTSQRTQCSESKMALHILSWISILAIHCVFNCFWSSCLLIWITRTRRPALFLSVVQLFPCSCVWNTTWCVVYLSKIYCKMFSVSLMDQTRADETFIEK